MNLDVFVLNAFADADFSGNPAAVVPLEFWLPDSTMQAIAAQHNLSETAFFTPREADDDYNLRWFTPTCEVDLCGHATLATAALLMTELAIGLSEVRFHTRSGSLEVKRLDNDDFELDFPNHPAVPTDPPPGMLEALGGQPEDVLYARSWLVTYPNEAAVRALKPDFAALARTGSDVIATAPGDEVDFVSRMFAPAFGVDEDPVTGSAHCTLTPYWAARLGKDVMRARQVSARGGRLDVTLAGDRVRIAGAVQPYLEGCIRI